MTWLRIDDRFTEHGKLIGLKRTERWTWLEVLTYCARQQNDGRIPAGISDILRHVTPAFLARCVELGLADQADDGSLTVHEFRIYNAATIAERVEAYLETHPTASANEVHKEVGGKREIVLAAVAAWYQQTGTEPVPDRYPNGTTGGSPKRARGAARALPSRPLPVRAEGDGRDHDSPPESPNGAAPQAPSANARQTKEDQKVVPGDAPRDHLTPEAAAAAATTYVENAGWQLGDVPHDLSADLHHRYPTLLNDQVDDLVLHAQALHAERQPDPEPA